jgi:NAD(P)-dependent dehydrogenase (short-subunit alcohol dehydrogenase family)
VIVMVDDAVCLVTGASKGIGAAIARAFGKRGARVVVNYRSDPLSAETVLRDIRAEGGDGFVFAADVSQPAEVDAMFDATLQRFGRLDVLVNNAGIVMVKPIRDTTPEDWDRVVGVNLKGQFLCARRAALAMIPQRSGRIINVTSGVIDLALANTSAYCPSKHGIVGLTRALAIELAPFGILVNAVSPGATDTPMNAEVYTSKVRGRYRRRIPVGRIGDAEDMVGAALFLASPSAAYVCGAVITVDGGLNINGTVGHGEH